MDAFVKSFSTYKTTHHLQVLSSTLVVDSLDAETGSVTVIGTSLGRGNAGDWLIVDGQLFAIRTVKPSGDRTVLSVGSVLDVFNRPLEYALENPPTIGAAIAQEMSDKWIGGTDVRYAIPYLSVSDSDTTPFAPPDLDSSGCYILSAYARLMRKAYNVRCRFSDTGDGILCTIDKAPTSNRNVSFEDGRSEIHSVDFSTSGIATITVLHDYPLQELDENNRMVDVKDENGETVMLRDRSTWYLSEDGAVSQSMPDRRADGGWDMITVSGNNDVETKVREVFAKNKATHKIEFYSELDLSVQDNCRFNVYGDSLLSYISYKRKDSTTRRYFYRSGELAVTASEKLRRLSNG